MTATATRDIDRLVSEEADLVAAAAAGDGAAFAVLYERYAQRAFNLAYRTTGSLTDAADAVPEAFVNAMRRLRRVADPELAFGSLLWSATHDACHELMDGRQHARPAETMQGELPEANMRLPERQREALALRELEELSYEEIAAIMATSSGMVAQLICRARINLCDELHGTVLASIGAPSPECERALPLIAMRDDKQLESGSREAAWLDAHLAGCHRCRLGVEAMQEAGGSIAAWEPAAAPPRLRRETMAKVATLLGAEWSGEISQAAAAPTAVARGTPSRSRAGPVRNDRSRRRVGLAFSLAALLLLGGLALAFARDNPASKPTSRAADAVPLLTGPGSRAGSIAAGKAGGHAAKKAKTRASAPSTATTKTSLGATPASVPGAIPTGTGSQPGESTSGGSPRHGKTAVLPTLATSAPTPTRKPKPAPTAPVAQPAPAPAPAPAPTTEEPPPTEESTKEAHRPREPPGKPPGLPPGH